MRFGCFLDVRCLVVVSSLGLGFIRFRLFILVLVIRLLNMSGVCGLSSLRCCLGVFIGLVWWFIWRLK